MRAFPTGNDFDANLCNTDDARPRPGAGQVGSFLQCRSAYGVADLSGNVAEWTASDFAGDTLASKTQKGGAFDRARIHAVRCSARLKRAPTEQQADRGLPVLRGRSSNEERRRWHSLLALLLPWVASAAGPAPKVVAVKSAALAPYASVVAGFAPRSAPTCRR